MRYPNVPQTIGIVVSMRLATLHELETVYGIQDVYDMLEICVVDNENKRRVEETLSSRDK
jgi:hypothetical protein